MAKKKKLHKKELTEKDQVLTTLERGWALLEKHAYKVAAFMLGALVISGGWALWGHLSYQSRTNACRSFIRALKTYNAPVVPEGGSAPKGRKTFPTEKARAEAALEAFRKVIREHGSHGLSRAARYYEGNCLYQLGRYDEAIAAFKKFLSGKVSGCGCGGVGEGINGAMRSVALENLGYCYEAKGQWDKALEAFRDMEKVADGVRKDWALYHQARVYEAKKELKKALALYEQVPKADKHAAFSPLAGYVSQRVTYLKAALEAGGRAESRGARPSEKKGRQPAGARQPGQAGGPAATQPARPRAAARARGGGGH